MPKVKAKTINSWSDINALAAKSDKRNGNTIAVYADAFGIPYWGITLLQGKPYINTLGLEWKWQQYPGELESIGSKRILTYAKMGEDQVALVKVWGKTPRGYVSAVGSGMSSNLRGNMEGYPNEMAETRAMNRLIRRALLPKIYEDFFKNLQDMGDAGKQLLRSGKVQDIVSTSAEEIAGQNEVSQKPVILTQEENKVIAPYLEQLNGSDTLEELNKISKTIGEDKGLNEKQRQRLRQVFYTVITQKELS